MAFELPALPYDMNALEPHISKETLEYHYGKHHQAYVNNLNKLIEESAFANATLEEIIMNAKGGLFNNAAQVWNHTFYWHCLSPAADQAPDANVTQALEQHFDSVDNFKALFSEKAKTTFGSGWAWLVKNADGSLEITSTANADTPMTSNQTALLTCDVWEHAYYIDYRNARPSYIDAFWKLVNWEFVSKNLQG